MLFRKSNGGAGRSLNRNWGAVRETPPVSVVVPVRDSAATLADCIDSLLVQDYPSGLRQFIAVDNGSRDDSRSVLGRYGRKLTLLDEPLPGPAAARNRGIAAAEGQIIAFLDADCIAERDWLSRLVAALQTSAAEAVGGRIRAVEEGNPIALFGERIHDHQRALTTFVPPYLIGMNWAVHAAALRAVHGFDNRFRRGEDVDLAWRLLQNGCRLAYAPDAVVYHRNEVTLRGLFREGWQHGFYGILVSSVHREFLARHNYRASRFHSARRSARALRNWISVREDRTALYAAVFDGGKAIGRLFGCARFRYLDP